MSLNSRLEQLRKKHATLKEKVETVQRSPSADRVQVTELKKQKLRLKEEIQRLSQS